MYLLISVLRFVFVVVVLRFGLFVCCCGASVLFIICVCCGALVLFIICVVFIIVSFLLSIFVCCGGSGGLCVLVSIICSHSNDACQSVATVMMPVNL